MDHPLNPDARLLTELWERAIDGEELAAVQYFRCLAVATRRQTVLHIITVRARLRAR